MRQQRTFLFALLPLLIFAARISESAERRFIEDAIVNPSAFYPEGPQLIDDGLLVAEMPRDRVVLIAKDQVRTVWQRAGCGPTSIKKIPSGGYWVLCHLGHYVSRLGENFETLHVLRHTASGRRINSPNDASVDSDGNLYLSSSGLFALSAPPEGRVIFVDVSTNSASDLVGGLRFANGILVQERHGRLLVAEHLNRRILAFPILGKGKLGRPEVFFDFKDAPAIDQPYERSGPDGIASFADGDICVADYGNGRILILSDSGRFSGQALVRYRFVTNLAITKDQRSVYVLMTQSNASAELHGIVERFRVQTAP